MKTQDSAKIFEIREHGYNIHSRPRAGRGGGVAFLFKKDLDVDVKRHNVPNIKSFEVVETVIKGKHEMLRCCTVYRTSVKSKTKIDYAQTKLNKFLDEFAEYLDSLILKPGKPIISGDLNFHLEDLNCDAANTFKRLISSRGFVQHVNEPTHILGGTLDVIVTRDNVTDYIDIRNIEVHCNTGTTSDHYLLTFQVPFLYHSTENNTSEVIEFRKYKDIDIESFKKDILESSLHDMEQFKDLENTVKLYNDVLSSLIDHHAPLIRKTVKARQNNWWNNSCDEARRKRRVAERQYKKARNILTKARYNEECKKAEKVINETRNKYYQSKLEGCEGDAKETYNIVNKLLDKEYVKNKLPNGLSDETIANELKDYFHNKITKIYDGITVNCSSTIEHDIDEVSEIDDHHELASPNFANFQPITSDTMKSIISKMSQKSCCLDAVPTWLVSLCLDELMPILLFIVNESLEKGIFPSILKVAAVRPCLKKHNLDCDELKNYRPISNLQFLSKLLEKCAHTQLTAYVNDNELHATYQSGYRAHHSCETAIVKIHNDLVMMVDKRDHAVLMLLDLSAAFDTLNHTVLLQKLKSNFKIKGEALKWLESYLTGRSFTVKVRKASSGKCYLTIGVPQGSILGPLLFIMYTAELESIALKYGFNIHLFADDTQLYFSFDPHDNSKLHDDSMVRCFNEIKQWMAQNFLKLNDEKTEVLEIKPNKTCIPVIPSVTLDGCTIETVPSAKSLGFIFDANLSMKEHIEDITRRCYINLRNISRIGSKLHQKLKIQLVHSLILSHLDYCNSVIYGITDALLMQLQKVQNAAARFIFGLYGKKAWKHITPYLKKLHFLPVRYRLMYKVALLTFKCINNIAPIYLRNLIFMKSSDRGLRIDKDYFLLEKQPTPTYIRSERAFRFSSPTIWNSLPLSLRCMTNLQTFKVSLKMFFFNAAFSDVPDIV